MELAVGANYAHSTYSIYPTQNTRTSLQACTLDASYKFPGPSDGRSWLSTNIVDPTINNHIMISSIKKRKRPVQMIWDILHEFGRHLSGPPSKGDLRLSREEDAWNKAQLQFAKYAALMPEKEDFDLYMEEKLEDYRKRPNDRI